MMDAALKYRNIMQYRVCCLKIKIIGNSLFRPTFENIYLLYIWYIIYIIYNSV